MKQSEYKTQAYINDGLNQRQSLDSPEGSAALVQPDKPEVDATDIQKAHILAEAHGKQAVAQSLAPGNQMKTVSRPMSPNHTKR
jgi:hypothetical protein